MEQLSLCNRITEKAWSPAQLDIMAATHLECELDAQHEKAILALVDEAHRVDVQCLREAVLASCGTVAGRYWAIAALSCAQLAISYPHLLTRYQYELLLSPLVAAEVSCFREAEVLNGLAA